MYCAVYACFARCVEPFLRQCFVVKNQKMRALKSILPSKKFIIAFAAVFALIGGIFLLSRTQGVSAPHRRQRDAAKAQIADRTAYAPVEPKDTDGDGLADWEEVLWKTNPFNPDTDGDGIPDNIAVEKLQTQPDNTKTPAAIKAAGDGTTQTNTSGAARRPETLTDEVAQRLITDYLQLKQKKTTFSPNDAAMIAQNALKSVTDQQLADFYTPKNIAYADDSAGEQRRYVNEIGVALETHFGKFDANELDVYLSGVEKPGADAGIFDPYIAAYAGAEKELLAVAVPPPFLKLHLDLVNSFHNTAIAVEAMKTSGRDPARGTLGAGWYLREVDRSRDFLKNMYATIQQTRLVLSPREPGFLFVEYGIQL